MSTLTLRQKSMGIVVFCIAIAHFSFHGLAVKVILKQFALTSPEMVYYMSLFGLLAFFV